MCYKCLYCSLSYAGPDPHGTVRAPPLFPVAVRGLPTEFLLKRYPTPQGSKTC